MRNESIDTEPQTEKLSIAAALNHAETLIESSHYKEAREKLQGISNDFQFPILSPESYRLHYLRGLLLFRLGEQLAAWDETKEALRIFNGINGSISLPERETLPDFVRDNLRKLRDIEIALMAGLQEPDDKQGFEIRKKLEETVVDILSGLDNLNPLAKLHYLSGCIKMHLSKLDESMDQFERAAIGFKLSKDWASLARTSNRISQIYHLQGKLEMAIHFLEEARYFALRAEDRYFVVFLRHNLAHCQLLSGAWRPAVPLLLGVLSETQKSQDIPSYASTLLSWGHANLLRERFKEGRKSLTEAFRLAKEQNLIGVLKLAHGYSAEFCLVVEQLEEAEAHLKKALEIARRVTPGGSTETQAWRVLGDVYTAQKQYEKALSAYAACQNCLAKFPEKLEEGAMYRGLGTLYSYRNQVAVARHNFRKALDIFEACGNQWEKAKTFVIAVESGVFTQAEMEPDLAWAKEVFKRLEHPAWAKRTRALLKRAKSPGRALPLPVLREQTERKEIVNALLACNGNITQTAKKLGLLRQTLQYKIRHYAIEV